MTHATITTTLAELRERRACDKGLAFAESIATPGGTISFELTPLTWVWLEAEGRRWASWLGIPCPNHMGANLCGASARAPRTAGAW